MWELCDIALVIIFVAATASNSLVLLVFYRRPGLRTLSNRFVINLLGTNLFSCWMLLPMVFLTSDSQSTTPLFCTLCRITSTGFCTASIFSVLLIGVDQYFAVTDPLHYRSRINNHRSIVLISSAWIASLVVGVAGGLFGGKSVWSCCSQPAETTFSDITLTVFAGSFFILVFLLPFVALCWIYISIYTAAHKNSQRTRRNGSTSGYYCGSNASDTHEYMIVPTTAQDTFCTKADLAKPLARSPTKNGVRNTSGNIVSTLKYRISNASVFRYREETRAARISALVIVMALVCWLPFSLILLLDSPMLASSLSISCGKLSLTLLVSGSIISPLLFAHRNRRIQRDLGKLLGLTKKSSFNRSVMRSYDQRRLSESQRNARKFSTCSADSEDDSIFCISPSYLVSRLFCNKCGKIVGAAISESSLKTDVSFPVSAVQVDNGRSSFSSGASTTSTQRSTSVASISDTAEEY